MPGISGEYLPMHNIRLSRERAEALEELNSSRPVKVIAVTGGKGGVGKTTISANFAVSMAAQGRDVMLLDADLGLANVDVVLGLHTRFHMGHVIKGECSLEDAIVTGPHGLQITPASSARSAISITGLKSWWWIPRRDCRTASRPSLRRRTTCSWWFATSPP